MIEIYANNGEYVLSQAVYGLGETFSYKMEKNRKFICGMNESAQKFLTHTGFCSNLVRNSFLTLK